MDYAGATLAGVTTYMSSGKSKCLAQECDKKCVVCDVMAYRLAIYLHSYGWHSLSPVQALHLSEHLFFLLSELVLNLGICKHGWHEFLEILNGAQAV